MHSLERRRVRWRCRRVVGFLGDGRHHSVNRLARPDILFQDIEKSDASNHDLKGLQNHLIDNDIHIVGLGLRFTDARWVVL